MSDPYQTRPLLSFSLYTDIQADVIRRVGGEILDISAQWTEAIDSHQRAYDLFWLWVLGAYELTRTMDAFNHRFSEAMTSRTKALKSFLGTLRMPFAKQELKGKRKVVRNELSIYGYDKGMLFEIEGNIFNSSDVIRQFIAFLDSITFADLGIVPLRVNPRSDTPGGKSEL
jgi:hypothetical protein